MRLQLITRGRKFDLYAIDLSDSPSISNRNTIGEFKMAVSNNGGDARAEVESGYLDKTLSKLARDPEFVAEGLALTLAEDILRVMKDNEVSKSELARENGCIEGLCVSDAGCSAQPNPSYDLKSGLGAGPGAKSSLAQHREIP